MAFFSVEAAGPLLSLAIAGLFMGTLVYLARLNQRLGALRGAQSELHGLLRACSDNVDAAEKSIAALRGAAQTMAGDLGRSLERAEELKADIDATCAAASRLLARLSEEPAVREMKALGARPTAVPAARSTVPVPPVPPPASPPATPAGPPVPPRRKPVARLADPEPADPSGPADGTGPAAEAPEPVEPRWTDRLRPASTDPGEERPALRLFRDTIRAL